MQCGPKWHATLAEIAGGADILITMLPGSREVREVMALTDPQRIIRVGGNGAGYTAKLLVNLLWFGQAAATGQALLPRFKSVSNIHPSRIADRPSSAFSTPSGWSSRRHG
ncbi:MAG TPA: hypothetical protein VMA72_10045 [Streptosporangiaceae bacterium]|nr:hypothetical protein [Streptosporangiaceae bacterium]